jgi:hypothetical protein
MAHGAVGVKIVLKRNLAHARLRSRSMQTKNCERKHRESW